MKWIASGLLCCALLVIPADTDAQQTGETALSPVLQVNPLGFLQFGPNFEVEFPISPMVSVSPGLRIATLGLIPHLLLEEGESLGLAWTVSATTHLYPEAAGMRGFYLGPRFEVGRGSSSDEFADYDSTILVGAVDFGYRMVYPSGLHLTFGAQTGEFLDSWEGSDGTSADEGYVFAMLVLGLGVEF